MNQRVQVSVWNRTTLISNPVFFPFLLVYWHVWSSINIPKIIAPWVTSISMTRACQICKVLGPTSNLLIQNLWEGVPRVCFNKSSRWFWYTLKFEEHTLKNTEKPGICLLKVISGNLGKANKMILGKLDESWWTGDHSNPSGTSRFMHRMLMSRVPLGWPTVLFSSALSTF